MTSEQINFLTTLLDRWRMEIIIGPHRDVHMTFHWNDPTMILKQTYECSSLQRLVYQRRAFLCRQLAAFLDPRAYFQTPVKRAALPPPLLKGTSRSTAVTSVGKPSVEATHSSHTRWPALSRKDICFLILIKFSSFWTTIGSEKWKTRFFTSEISLTNEIDL